MVNQVSPADLSDQMLRKLLIILFCRRNGDSAEEVLTFSSSGSHPELLPWCPGGPGSPGGPGNPSLPGGPGGPWTCEAKMPAGVFCSMAALVSFSTSQEKKQSYREYLVYGELTYKMHFGQFVPSKIFTTSFRTNVLSSSMKVGSPCIWEDTNIRETLWHKKKTKTSRVNFHSVYWQ